MALMLSMIATKPILHKVSLQVSELHLFKCVKIENYFDVAKKDYVNSSSAVIEF